MGQQLFLLVFAEAHATYHELEDIPTPLLPPKSTPWLRIATDKDRLIKRILSSLVTITAFAGAALCSEYKVANEILEIERRLPFKLTWEHVRSHQDDKKKWYELTWMETLKVRADTYGTPGLVISGDPQIMITVIPSSKIRPRIDQIDITSKSTQRIFVKQRRNQQR